MLFTVHAHHFTAGLTVDDGTKLCTRAAPIIRYFQGNSLRWISDYCQRKRWSLAEVAKNEAQIGQIPKTEAQS